jgi:hypothetical protein
MINLVGALDKLNNGGDMNELEEKLICAFSDVGAQIGDILRCMVSQEISANLSRVQQLNAILNGNVCNGANITTPTI